METLNKTLRNATLSVSMSSGRSPDSPSRMAALPNVAVAAQIRMSAARHSASPAPTHGPLTAAMTGCGMARIACGSSPIAS